MKTTWIPLIIGSVLALAVSAQENPLPSSDALLQNAFNRPATSLNGDWHYLVDRYETSVYNFWRIPFDSVQPEDYGRDAVWLDETPKDKTDRLEYDWDSAATLTVPGDWNSQVNELLFYEGSIWYRTKFDDPRTDSKDNLLLYFGGANYRTDVYLNGRKVGSHIGGFTPFNFFIGQQVKPIGNSLVVRVDNQRDPSGVPTDVTDWWNYGGLTRDVKLITLPQTYIQDYSIRLDPERPEELTGYVQLEGSGVAGQELKLSCPELDLVIPLTTDQNGKATFNQSLKGVSIERWDTENPRLYEFTITAGPDRTTDRIGLRTIETRGSEILLNGKPIFLRGICSHEENPLKGSRANSEADARQLMAWARELQANFMRLAHYPHNEYMPRLADELGILLWEEIPVYWTIDWKNEATYALAEQQLGEVLFRDKNRASVIIWSLANETPDLEEKVRFLRRLAEYARGYDNSRLISAALFKSKSADGKMTVSDPFSAYTDIIAFNEYLGWYEGTPEILDGVEFVFNQQKPVLVSEWGAGALAGFHGDALTRWSEEYQDYLYQEQLELMDRMPQLAGFTPWILSDFRSPRRMHPQYQKGWNRKGVISQEGERKQAFYRLQAYYDKKKKAETEK